MEFNVGLTRRGGLEVIHTPDPETCNRAHSSVYGHENRVRVTLGRIAEWVPGFELREP